MADTRDHYPTYYALARACAALAAISRDVQPDRITHHCTTEEEFERLPGAPSAPSVVDRTISSGRYQRLKSAKICGVFVLLRYERAATEQDFQERLQEAAQTVVKRLEREHEPAFPATKTERDKFIF